MKKKIIDYPAMMTRQDVADYLNASKPTSLRIMHKEGFPLLIVGNRMMVRRDRFEAWLDKQADLNAIL